MTVPSGRGSLLILLLFISVLKADHEHGETRHHKTHMGNSRISRWHVHNRMDIPVNNMRADCMSGSLFVRDISMIQTGSVCHANRSKLYIEELKTQIENCSRDDNCDQVKWQAEKMLTSDCVQVAQLHDFRYFCSLYLRQYQQQCEEFFRFELLHTSEVTALDVEVECLGLGDPELNYSQVTLYEKQPINIGHLINECHLQNPNKYLHIVGFVEAAEKCPADKTADSSPYTHPLVQTLQEHADNHNSIVDFDVYQHNLSLRLICGNVIFPVVYDGLLSLSRSHGWIYYKCGMEKDSVGVIDWNHMYHKFMRFNFKSEKIRAAIPAHCSWTHKFIVVLLLLLLGIAISCEIFTIYRRDDIVDFFKAQKRITNNKMRVSDQSRNPTPLTTITDVESSVSRFSSSRQHLIGHRNDMDQQAGDFSSTTQKVKDYQQVDGQRIHI